MGKRQLYGDRVEERVLHEFAQHNRHCERVWAAARPTAERGEFQRDRERIVNAKAFRRMVDKAQIFTSSKGDHYRTRMTHTMEVAQIARSIANSLGLNIDLTEAIALGHDLGHTPFGHQGERTLQDILNGRVEAGLPKVLEKNVYGGFKHNFQSVRMLNCLEEKYTEHEGLDVSYQVLEGVLKHTGYRQKACAGCTLEKCPRSCCDLQIFLGQGDVGRLFMDVALPTTLEAQVVEVADEIAQRSHDVDDAMSAGMLDYARLKVFLDENKMGRLQEMISHSWQEIGKGKREYVSIEQMICARAISDIINFLVNDVVAESRERMRAFKGDDFYGTEHRFSSRLIGFTKEGENACKLLEGMVKRMVIGSPEVAKFDYNAANIVSTLFRIYYGNPRLLHVGTLRRIMIEIRRETGETVDLAYGEPGEVENAFRKMTGTFGNGHFVDWTDGQKREWKKHVILVRNIVDYIAGMTDSYARNEYRSFCGGF